MTEYIQQLRQFYVMDKKQRAYWQDPVDPHALAAEFSQLDLDDIQRATLRLTWMLEHEKPVVFPDERIAILRTIPKIPELFTHQEWADQQTRFKIHEQGKVCNINPGYALVIDEGFYGIREHIVDARHHQKAMGNTAGLAYLKALDKTLDAVEQFAERYRQEALRVGNTVVADTFSHIPQNKPRNFQEALQFFRLLHFCLWESFNYHNTVGRFDQYMLPYYRADMESGRLDDGSALELLEEFFISFNKDSDNYPGMQQGDNGQSLMLGGRDVSGVAQFNALSQLCMQASLELKLIDPKINLRVDRNTPLWIYELGTQMTKQGLGFPQYSNDDVVIPALERWGYSHQDACDYVVAACWEFIVPKVAMDIVNIDGMSFLEAVMKALPELPDCQTYADFAKRVRQNIFASVDTICARTNHLYMEPSPMMSLMMAGCVEQARDIRDGATYNNYGIHGTGLSSAADSMAAIHKYVFDEHSVGAGELLVALEADFVGYDRLWSTLRYDAPKMGNDDDYVDAIATELLDWFADSLEGRKNDRGGIFRAGTGSAMYYLWHAKEVGASPDGRKKGEALACNFSPSLFTRAKGPISILKSFSKEHLVRVANGGPLTIELHDTLFRTPDSIRKVAMFIKTYMDMGGHQMQINAVNRETMFEAQKHPENYRNLIVRVWGWSGYFVELDKAYQDHIIKRMEIDM